MNDKIKVNTPPILGGHKGFLALEDFAGKSEADVRTHLLGEYQGVPELVNSFDILIAYESVGSWGCDSSSWFLLRRKETGELYENSGSHCSCYGFEGQFGPELTTVEYLKSDRFSFSCGGYDGNESANRDAVKQWIRENL